MYGALQILGVPIDECWLLLQRIANNSMPRIRFNVIYTLLHAEKDLTGCAELSTKEIAMAVNLPNSTVERSLYDLVSHGVLIRRKKSEMSNAINFWSLSEWTEKTLKECS